MKIKNKQISKFLADLFYLSFGIKGIPQTTHNQPQHKQPNA